MRRRILRFFGVEHRFKREFKKQIRMLIIVTLGFTIAFSWRQTIFDLFYALVSFMTNVKDSSIASILTSIFITLISIILIWLTAHFLKDEPN